MHIKGFNCPDVFNWRSTHGSAEKFLLSGAAEIFVLNGKSSTKERTEGSSLVLYKFLAPTADCV